MVLKTQNPPIKGIPKNMENTPITDTIVHGLVSRFLCARQHGKADICNGSKKLDISHNLYELLYIAYSKFLAVITDIDKFHADEHIKRNLLMDEDICNGSVFQNDNYFLSYELYNRA